MDATSVARYVVTASSMLDGTNDRSTQRARRHTESGSATIRAVTGISSNASTSATVASAATDRVMVSGEMAERLNMPRRTISAQVAINTTSNTYAPVHR